MLNIYSIDFTIGPDSDKTASLLQQQCAKPSRSQVKCQGRTSVDYRIRTDGIYFSQRKNIFNDMLYTLKRPYSLSLSQWLAKYRWYCRCSSSARIVFPKEESEDNADYQTSNYGGDNFDSASSSETSHSAEFPSWPIAGFSDERNLYHGFNLKSVRKFLRPYTREVI